MVKKYGWEFIFIGANIDAYAEAQKYGIRRDRAVNYVSVKLYMLDHVYQRGGIMFFKKKTAKKTYDKDNRRPVIKASICNGEQVAGFQDIHTGAFEEVMLIRSRDDLAEFMSTYGIEDKIEKIY